MAKKRKPKAIKPTEQKESVKVEVPNQEKTPGLCEKSPDYVPDTAQAPPETQPEPSPEPTRERIEIKQPCETGYNPDEVFKLFGKVQYWKNPVFINSKGKTVFGAVTLGDKREFFAMVKEPDLKKWFRDFCPMQKREDDARVKMKNKYGTKKD